MLNPILFTSEQQGCIFYDFNETEVKGTMTMFLPSPLQIDRMMRSSFQIPSVNVPSSLCIYCTAYIYLACYCVNDSVDAHYIINLSTIFWFASIKNRQIQLNRMEALPLNFYTRLNVVLHAFPRFRHIGGMFFRISKWFARLTTARFCQSAPMGACFLAIACRFRSFYVRCDDLLFCLWRRRRKSIARSYACSTSSIQSALFVLIKELYGGIVKLLTLVAVLLPIRTVVWLISSPPGSTNCQSRQSGELMCQFRCLFCSC